MEYTENDGPIVARGMRGVSLYIGDGEYHEINPPPGWMREKMIGFNAAGVFWWNQKRKLRVAASVAMERDDKLWLHVSCSNPKRMPTYDEMALVKKIFVGDDKYAISVIPPKDKHVNTHIFCLHWWSCIDGHPLPEFSVCGEI